MPLNMIVQKIMNIFFFLAYLWTLHLEYVTEVSGMCALSVKEFMLYFSLNFLDRYLYCYLSMESGDILAVGHFCSKWFPASCPCYFLGKASVTPGTVLEMFKFLRWGGIFRGSSLDGWILVCAEGSRGFKACVQTSVTKLWHGKEVIFNYVRAGWDNSLIFLLVSLYPAFQF